MGGVVKEVGSKPSILLVPLYFLVIAPVLRVAGWTFSW